MYWLAKFVKIIRKHDGMLYTPITTIKYDVYDFKYCNAGGSVEYVRRTIRDAGIEQTVIWEPYAVIVYWRHIKSRIIFKLYRVDNLNSAKGSFAFPTIGIIYYIQHAANPYKCIVSELWKDAHIGPGNIVPYTKNKDKGDITCLDNIIDVLFTNSPSARRYFSYW